MHVNIFLHLQVVIQVRKLCLRELSLQMFMLSTYIVHILSIINCLVERLQITISASTNVIKITGSIGRTWGVVKLSYKILGEER
jgi:hypothetical protein